MDSSVAFTSFLIADIYNDETLSLEEAEHYAGNIGIAFIVLAIPVGLAYLYCFYTYLLRLWREVPTEFARTTPEKAAGFSLIPIFCWYWWFTAFLGLYQDMNKTVESYGIASRFNTAWIKTACICWVVFAVFANMAGRAMNPAAGAIGSMIWMTLSAAITFPTLWMIRKNVLEFIDIQTGRKNKHE